MKISTFKIEKSIPLPPPRRGSAKPTKYRRLPLKEMEIGDSFFCRTKDSLTERLSMQNAARRLGMKVAIRSMNGGIRVWRVE